jgi:hypothetical protein
LLIEFIQIAVGGELRVKDKFLRQTAGPLLPILYKMKDLVILIFFPQVGIAATKDPCGGILGDKSEDALLTTAAFGDIMFLYQGIFPVKRDGVKVQIKGNASIQPQAGQASNPKRMIFG